MGLENIGGIDLNELLRRDSAANDPFETPGLLQQPEETAPIELERPSAGQAFARALADAISARASAINPNVKQSNFSENAKRLAEFRRREKQERADRQSEKKAQTTRAEAELEFRRRESQQGRLDKQREKAEDVKLGKEAEKRAERRAIEAEERGLESEAELIRLQFDLKTRFRDSEPPKPDPDDAPRLREARTALRQMANGMRDDIEKNGLKGRTRKQIADSYIEQLKDFELDEASAREMAQVFSERVLPAVEAAQSKEQGQPKQGSNLSSPIGLAAEILPLLRKDTGGIGGFLGDLLLGGRAKPPVDRTGGTQDPRLQAVMDSIARNNAP